MQSQNPFIVQLDSPYCLDKEMVGAKALRLSQLIRMGFPVPPAFVLSVSAFEYFCQYNQIILENNSDATRELSTRILNGSFPNVLLKSIKKHFNSRASELFAVRSSCVAEDGYEYSMAGQYHTFLNTPECEIPKRIKACWAGVLNEAAVAYEKKGQRKRTHRMGVIVQKQITPLYSGVLFTLDPQTRVTDHFVIEWVTGLGDRLVSGKVIPKRTYIHRSSLQVDEDIDSKLKPFLKTLINYAVTAEKKFNYPVDMEWCADDTLHLLQIRPVTAFIKQNSIIWTNVNMVENFPQPLSSFTFSIVDKFYTAYLTNILKMFGWKTKQLKHFKTIINNLTGIQGGRIYYNLSSWYEALYFFPIGKYLKPLLDNYIGQTVPISFSSKIDQKSFEKIWRNPFKHVQFWWKLAYFHFTSKKHLNSLETKFHQLRTKWRKTPYHKKELTELVNGIDTLFTEFVDEYYYCQGIADISVMIFPGILTQIIQKWFPEYKETPNKAVMQLFQGLHIKSTEPARIISRIAGYIKSEETLQSLLIAKKYDLLEQRLDNKTGALLDRFMKHFGARCYNECMIVSPTFEERHDLFWNLVEKYQSVSDLTTKTDRDEGQVRQKRLSRQLEKKLPFSKRMLFKTVLKNSYHAIGLREKGRLIRSLLFGEIRLMVLEIGKCLNQMGHLNCAEDVFHLQLSEIEQITHGKFQFPETILTLIRQRKMALKRCDECSSPELFISEPGIFYKELKGHEQSLDKKTLKGTGVSAGMVRGIARIILDPLTDNRLKPGEILVTRTTDPGWTPLFIVAGGLVLERGGLLSHGAIVSREFSIPAVVGIENATQCIKDGDPIKMDGMTGIVEILRN